MTQRDLTQRPLLLPAVLPVVGVSFHQDVVAGLRVGDVLDVFAEPENPYDSDACVFLRDGEVVGHVPRALAGRLRRTGSHWKARVEEVLPGDMAIGLRVRILASDSARSGDECALSSTTATPAPVVPQATESPAQVSEVSIVREVRARSGRLLGRFVAHEGSEVVVSSEDGRLVRFPDTLVVVP
jgi:hypothetical protein